MANALQSYVEKFILNPSKNIDEDGNEIESGQLVDKLTGDEAPSSVLTISKLRMQNAALLSEKDPKYKGNKVSRKSLNKDDSGIDPELAKLCMIEGEESEEEEEFDSIEEADVGNDTEGEESNFEGGEDIEEEEEESEYAGEDDNDETMQMSSDNEDQMDYSQFADESGESENDSDGDENDVEDDIEDMDTDDENEDSVKMKKLNKLISDDDNEEINKAQAIQHQLGLFDKLFAMRIMAQKLLLNSKQLPQPDVYSKFKDQNDSNYNTNLNKARKNTRNLMDAFSELQELLLKGNNEKNKIISGSKSKDTTGTASDEEITSSEDEIPDEEIPTQSKKRKWTNEECDEHLSKRFAGIIPYRDKVYNTWYEKTKLLSTQKTQSKFEKFEVSALQQLKNILKDKNPLIKRTQLSSISRGNTARTLGKIVNIDIDAVEEYDAEIFDDSDFYKRMLEEVVKSKVSLSDNMVDVSRKWIEIQNLRKKVKKNISTKASKGRKIRYDVMSKLQDFLPPCQHPTMDNLAINSLFRSLFGNSGQNVSTNKKNNDLAAGS